MNNSDLLIPFTSARVHRVSRQYSLQQIVHIVQCGLGGLILVINLIFLIILSIGRWRLQRPKRYVFTANLALADAISGLVLIGLALIVLFEWYGGSMIRLLLETTVSASFAMCTLTCNAILRMQYVSVRRPWRYFLYLTKFRLFAIILLIWTIAHAYAFAKGYVLFFQSTQFAFTLALCELAVMAAGWMINLIIYILVLKLAMEKVKMHRKRMRSEGKTRAGTERLIEKDCKERNEENEDETRFCCSPKSEYVFLITVGLNLCVFICSYTPIWINWAMDIYWKQEVYFDQRNVVTRHMLLLACFLRAVFEPVVHVLRQPKLICGNQYRDMND